MKIENKMLYILYKIFNFISKIDPLFGYFITFFCLAPFTTIHVTITCFYSILGLFIPGIAYYFRYKILCFEINKLKPGKLAQYCPKKENIAMVLFNTNNFKEKFFINCNELVLILEKPIIKNDLYNSIYVEYDTFGPKDCYTRVKVLYKNKIWWTSPKRLKVVK